MRTKSPPSILPRLYGPAFVLTLASCGGDGVLVPGDGSIAKLEAVAGNGQRATVGQPIPEPLVVRAVDRVGRPVTDVDIAFRFINTDGRVAPGVTTTGVDGQATAEVTLGRSVGNQVVEARLVDESGVAVEFELTGLQPESPEGGDGGGGTGGTGGNGGNGGNGGGGGGGSVGGDDGGGSGGGSAGGDDGGGSGGGDADGGSGGSDDGGNSGHDGGNGKGGHDKDGGNGGHHGGGD